MATQPTVVTGAVTVSGDTTNAELRRLVEANMINDLQQIVHSIMATERETSQMMGYEIR